MSDNVWQILGLLTAGVFFCAALFLIWVWIESEFHARRLRKMQEEADKKRFYGPIDETEYRPRAKRAQFLTTDNTDGI